MVLHSCTAVRKQQARKAPLCTAPYPSIDFRNSSLSLHHRRLLPNSIDTRPPAVHSNTMVGLTSAAGVVGFLSEPDPALRSFALQRLNDEIDLLWPEVAGSVSQM